MPFSLGIHFGFLSVFLFFQYACTFLFDKASPTQLFVNFQGPTLAHSLILFGIHNGLCSVCVHVCVCVREPVKCNEQTQHDAVYVCGLLLVPQAYLLSAFAQ